MRREEREEKTNTEKLAKKEELEKKNIYIQKIKILQGMGGCEW